MEELNKTSVSDIVQRITTELKKVIVEQQEFIEYSLIGLLTGGHILIEGVPGLGKTLLVRALAKTISSDFKRIQFTPDLMPADITGTKIFNLQSREFDFKQGPIFTNLLLADEINRTPPKTQAGLLEAMAENSVTIDGEFHPLSLPFIVFATQNPLEYEGTYPLPETLIDRFLMKLYISYPSFTAEKEILKRFNEGFQGIDLDRYALVSVCTPEEITNSKNVIEAISVHDELMNYIVAVVTETRKNPMIDIGSSPRGALALLQCSKAMAAFRGRDYIIPEDIKEMTLPVLRHRIILKPELELEGVSADQVLLEILKKIKVPR